MGEYRYLDCFWPKGENTKISVEVPPEVQSEVYPVAIPGDLPAGPYYYNESIKKQIRYAAGTSFILALISFL